MKFILNNILGKKRDSKNGSTKKLASPVILTNKGFLLKEPKMVKKDF